MPRGHEHISFVFSSTFRDIEDKRKAIARDTHTPTHRLASTTCVVWSACTRLGSKD